MMDSNMKNQGKKIGMRGKLLALGVLVLCIAAVAAYVLLRGHFGASSHPGPDKPAESMVKTLRLGHNMTEDSALHAAAVRFAQEVESRSQGKLKVSVHPRERLGNDLQMLEMAKEGELDMVLTPTAKLSASVPSMQYADLPYYFTSQEELYAMLDGEPGQILLGRLKGIGLVGVTFWGNGFKHFTANRPLHVPEDFRKLRFRTMKSKLVMDQFEALGAAPVPIEFQALYQALVDGAVDGQENPLVAIVGMNLHKVQPHLTLSGHAYLGYAFSISAKVFEHLTQEERNLLTTAARELTPWEREETQRRDAKFLEQIRTAGVTVYEPSPEERKTFVAALSGLARRFEPVVGSDLLVKTEEIRWQAMAQDKRANTLLLGLDADLSSGDGSEVGMAIRRGMELAVDEINAQGGVQGKQLRIVARDHRGIPGEGLKNVRAFSAMPEMVAVLGGKHSFVIAEEMNLIHEQSMPYLVPWAAASKITANGHEPNYVFRLSLQDHDVAPFLMERAGKGGRKVALLLEQSVWGRSNEAAVGKWVQAGGRAPVATLWFNRGEKDFSGAMAEIGRAQADTVLVVANAVEAAYIANAMAQQPRPLPVYSHWGVIGAEFQTAAKEALGKLEWHTVSTLPLRPEAMMPQAALKLLHRYEAAYGIAPDEPIPAFMGAAHAYDLVHLLAAAMRKAKSADRKAVRIALEELANQPGVIHDYRQPFTAQRHDALNRDDLKLVRFDKAGHLVRAE